MPILLVACFAVLGFLAAPALAGGPLWVDYPASPGPGGGRHIVLVSGDEEYRSEEALPQLGKILSRRHGFNCRVVFAVNPETGEIDPDNRSNIPGLEALDDADLMIIFTRFRDLPDEQMAHIDRYIRSGKPIIGMRTATHAFNAEKHTTYSRYNWNNADPAYEGGFGRRVLGETWVAHHGDHGHESTRGIIAPDRRDHPIARGLADGDIWGPTDVYRVRLPLPDGCEPIILGRVLGGMNPDDEPVENEKNDPLMPVGWTNTYTGDDGTIGRVFATTMGASVDLARAGTRRMLVNAVYWTLGMEDEIPADGTDVRLVGAYNPTMFGFGGYTHGVRPADHMLTPDDTPAPGVPSDP